jgi:DNA-binding NtrC family response regulator
MRDVTWQVLIASSDVELRRGIARILCNLDLDPMYASRVSRIQELMRTENIGLIFCDQFLEDGGYRDIAAACRSIHGHSCVVVILNSGDNGNELAIRQEVFGLVRTPPRPTEIEWMVIQARRSHLQTAGAARAAFLERVAGRSRAEKATLGGP